MKPEAKTITCPRCQGVGEVKPGRRMKPPRSIYFWIERACPVCWGDKLITESRFRLMYPQLAAQVLQQPLPLIDSEVA